jgi:mRNA interferase RelE/StbE
MRKYQVNLTEKAERFLKKLDKTQQDRIKNKLYDLENNPRLGKPLTGDLKGMWSLRAGKYRCIYVVKDNELMVIVIDIDHRKKVYDK